MTIAFLITAALILAGAVAAMTLRNLVHCALALVVALVGLAAAFLQLDAQFVGFAQILVYVGAVAILIVFAVLLTRGGEAPERNVFAGDWKWGALVAVLVFGTLAWAVKNSFVLEHAPADNAGASVKEIGDALMTRFVLPLEVIGLLLTAAMIGAVIIAMRDEPAKTRMEDGRLRMDSAASPSSSGGHS